MNCKTKKFIEKAIKIHGDKYDYSLVEYENCKKKIKIICPIHGIFEQTPDSHIQKTGCPSCSNNKKYSTEKFIEKAVKIHGDKYDYSLVNYTSSYKKIKIICPIHGIFEQTPASHTNQKCGCSKCNRKGPPLDNTESFIKKAIRKHKDKYDYSLVDYQGVHNDIIVIHKEYGKFTTTPLKILKNNYNHPLEIKQQNNLSEKEFLEKAIKIHDDKYDYSLVNYTHSKDKIKIICNSCKQILIQTPNSHLCGHGCYSCNLKKNNLEQIIESYLANKNLYYLASNRTIIAPKELDFYLPHYNLAIEVNGLRWHCEDFIGKNYHLDKTNLCKKTNITLIHLFEDEINNSLPIVKSKLNSILNINKYPIYARKCIVKEIDTSLKSKFLNKYHLQGNDKATVKLGLFYNNKLVSVMTFCKRRIALGKNKSEEGEYELSRYCGNFSFYVIGGASKLLKYFERNYNPKKIITYADKRWSQGDLYFKLGFKHTHDSSPNYWYTKQKNDRIHRFNFRKNVLDKKLDNFDPNKTEWENMKENGWNRIWDCGNMVFEKII